MARLVSLFTVNVLIMLGLMYILGLRINVSDSYPLGVYKRTEGMYSVGSLVESCLPSSTSETMLRREYIPSVGRCGGYPPVIKMIYAIAGDSVVVRNSVYVNDVMIPNSVVLSTDSSDRPIFPAHDTIIDEGHVWLMAMNVPNSYDARYFGQTPSDLILSNLRPLWTVK